MQAANTVGGRHAPSAKTHSIKVWPETRHHRRSTVKTVDRQYAGAPATSVTNRNVKLYPSQGGTAAFHRRLVPKGEGHRHRPANGLRPGATKLESGAKNGLACATGISCDPVEDFPPTYVPITD